MIDYSIIDWAQFDYIVYGYYLFLYHDFKLTSISPFTNSKGDIANFYTTDINILNKLKDNGYTFNWAMQKSYLDNIQFYDECKTCILYNIDR